MSVEAFARINYGDFVAQLAEVRGVEHEADELQVAAAGMHAILMSSWQKFVDAGVMTQDGLHRKINLPATQAELMAESKARYLLLYEGDQVLESPEQLRAFARVENYKPRLGKAYPNFSDLEVISGNLKNEHGARDARTLLYHGTHGYAMQRKVAAYTEAPNLQGRQFFQSHGFQERRALPPEVIDESSQIQYIHVEAPSIQDIYRTLPGGEHTFTYY